MFHLLDPMVSAGSRRAIFAARPVPPTLETTRGGIVLSAESGAGGGGERGALGGGSASSHRRARNRQDAGGSLPCPLLRARSGVARRADPRFFQLDVRSTTTAADLLYQFDNVAYFHAADILRAIGNLSAERPSCALGRSGRPSRPKARASCC